MAYRKCSRADKERFPSRLEANLAIARIASNVKHHRKGPQRDSEPTRSYQCEFCSGWHMTSQSKRLERAL